jgi:hypothetical protein
MVVQVTNEEAVIVCAATRITSAGTVKILGVRGSNQKTQSHGNEGQVGKGLYTCRNYFYRQGFQVGAELIGHVCSPLAHAIFQCRWCPAPWLTRKKKIGATAPREPRTTRATLIESGPWGKATLLLLIRFWA